jgi:hypothetical protein
MLNKRRGRGGVWLFILFVLFLEQPLFANYAKYNADSISEELKLNADGVIREYTTTFEIESISFAKRKVHVAVTILNKSGEHLGIFNEIYHKFVKIENFSGNVYDASGRLVKELVKKDFKDLSAISGYTLYDDTRRKYLSPVTNFFPYTIEYEYEIHYNGIYYYPTWYPISAYNQACENSRMIVVVPEKMNFRYLTNNITDSVSISNRNEKKIYSWEVKNIQAFINEELSPDFSQILPMIRLAPNNFEIDGYYGNQQTWESFGLWVKSLNNGKGNLNSEVREEIKSDIGEFTDTLSMIKKVYKYVQSRTRYVNLKLGIGGYQPIDAQTVHEVGYGDCKALSNYTKSILNIYGIDSYYTLVQAGDRSSNIEESFPSTQFNHAFLSVPIKHDTVWLECTSQTNPFGYIGDFTDNRQVLLITNDGGKIVNTPSYDDYNLIKRNINIIIDEKGNAHADMKFSYRGAEYSELSEMFELSDNEQKKWLYSKSPFTSMKVRDINVERYVEDTIIASILFKADLDNYASITNKRIFIPLTNFYDDLLPVLNPSTERRNDILIKDRKRIVNSLIFTYPAGYDIEYLPASSDLSFKFGSISVETQKLEEKNQMIVFSSLELKEGLYDKKDYGELLEFSDIINKNNNSKAVLVKKEKPE